MVIVVAKNMEAPVLSLRWLSCFLTFLFSTIPIKNGEEARGWFGGESNALEGDGSGKYSRLRLLALVKWHL